MTSSFRSERFNISIKGYNSISEEKTLRNVGYASNKYCLQVPDKYFLLQMFNIYGTFEEQLINTIRQADKQWLIHKQNCTIPTARRNILYT